MLNSEKLFGLVGGSLKNTFSKDYFTQKFTKQNLPYAYQNFELENIDHLIPLITENKNLFGLNITIPFKESVIPYLNQLNESAAKIGAVNCIKINRTPHHFELIGYNTDAFGFKVSLQKFIPQNFPTSALILGTGGASKAVQFVCNELQIDFTLVTSKLIESPSNLFNYKELNMDLLANNLLIINTTPLGMFPHVQLFPPINYEAINRNHFCFDLIYLPEETVFLNKAKKQGANIKNGLEMLNEQANKAFDIFVMSQ